MHSEAAIRVCLRPGAYPRRPGVLGLTTFVNGSKNSPKLTPSAGQDRHQIFHRNAPLSAFQPADVGTVRTPLRKSLVCGPGGIGVRSLPEETGHVARRSCADPLGRPKPE